MNHFLRAFWALTLTVPGLARTASAQTTPPNDETSAVEIQDEGDESTEPDGSEVLSEGEEGGEDPSRPPAAGKGVIWGVIKDTEFEEPLIEAPVQVIGTKIEVGTDEEGRFRLELPPGTYSLRISYELHKTQRIDGLVVGNGKVVRLDLQMVPDESATEEVEIVEEADKASLEGIILARQRASVASDSVGRMEISKSTDRNAAQAAQRIVGATVVGGRFVYVRGLGERYTNARLNGVPLPSPEPDRAAVPLDMFPSGILQSIGVDKMFSPDKPADFAGGSVGIETREIPNEPLLQLSARLSYNSQSTFRERLSSRGGNLDWLGIDDGTRALPDGFPKGYLGTSKASDEERRQAGLALNSYMSAQRSNTPPSFSLSAVGGSSWDLGENRKFGLVGALSYGQGYSIRRDEYLRLFNVLDAQNRNAPLQVLRNYRVTTGNVNVNWGGFASATFRFSPQHRVSLSGLRSTLSDNRTQYITGFHQGQNANIHATRLNFVTRALNLGLLTGEHYFPALGDAELDWNLVLSSATRDEPDRRDVVWADNLLNTNDNYYFTQAPESGRHFFSEQAENQIGGGFDWSQPLGGNDSKLKVGGLVSLRDRNFTSRNLPFWRHRRNNWITDRPCQPGQIDACNDALFRPENIGTLFELNEQTQPQDSYDATLNIYSGYAMADLGLGSQVRVLAGSRVEHTLQTVDPYDQFHGEGPPTREEPERARISQTDWLPALIATWSPMKKTKLRAAVTRTLARPQLRELAPFDFQDFFGGRLTGGNPNLELTSITNVDTRLEHFPTPRDVLAFSLFYKDFRKPIEPVILAGGDGGSMTFENASGASLIGVELEARRSLEFLTSALHDFTVITNLTLAHSRIQVPTGGSISLTNASRPLVNQAPWVFNFALDYAGDALSARLLYNVVGPRVVQVGALGLDDVYEHPRSILDLTIQKKLGGLAIKLEGNNLLNARVLQTQGCGSPGVFGSTWHLSCSNGATKAVSKYRDGVSVAMSASYDF